MDLSVSYLGLKLSSPIIPGASPLPDSLDTARRLEDAGAPAIVMRSLFEEQIAAEQLGFLHGMETQTAFPSAYPRPDQYVLSPAAYLEQVRRLKEAVRIPVIASLNGTTDIGWTGFARLIQQAGADALELNIYHVTPDLWMSGVTVESHALEIVRSVRMTVTIPVAVKIYPFFTSLASFCRQLDEIGVEGLVLFNRTCQPDFDIETRQVHPDLRLSEPSEIFPRLFWVALLSGRLQMSLALTGGVHTATDALKAIFAGADVVQVVSALLIHGADHIRTLRDGISSWMEAHGYSSLEAIRGSMNVETRETADSRRASYLHLLQGWRPTVV